MAVPEPDAVRWVLLGGVTAVAVLIAVELSSHGSRHVELAVDAMTKGAYAKQFWWGGVVLGLVVPAALVIVALAAEVDGPALARARPAWPPSSACSPTKTRSSGPASPCPSPEETP